MAPKMKRSTTKPWFLDVFIEFFTKRKGLSTHWVNRGNLRLRNILILGGLPGSTFGHLIPARGDFRVPWFVVGSFLGRTNVEKDMCRYASREDRTEIGQKWYETSNNGFKHGNSVCRIEESHWAERWTVVNWAELKHQHTQHNPQAWFLSKVVLDRSSRLCWDEVPCISWYALQQNIFHYNNFFPDRLSPLIDIC